MGRGGGGERRAGRGGGQSGREARTRQRLADRSPRRRAPLPKQASVGYLKVNAKRFTADGLAKMLSGICRCGYTDEALVSLMHHVAEMLKDGSCDRWAAGRGGLTSPESVLRSRRLIAPNSRALPDRLSPHPRPLRATSTA